MKILFYIFAFLVLLLTVAAIPLPMPEDERRMASEPDMDFPDLDVLLTD